MGQVYDPVLKRMITDVEADALNEQRRQHALPDGTSVDLSGGDAFVGPREHGFFGLRNPGDDRTKDVGLDVPPMASEDATNLFAMFPQLAGLAAQFVPGGKTASFAVPTSVELIRQLLSGEDLNPLDAAIEGIQGFAANRVGAGVAGIGNKGRDMVTRSLALRGVNKSDKAIKELTDLAINEGAEMTQEGARAIRTAGRQTLPNGVKLTSKPHMALADTLDAARLEAATSPNRITFWPQEALANALRQGPRELRMGRALANPVAGVSTASHLAPSVEAAMRLKLIQMAGNEPPLHSSRGPVRRRLK